MITKPRHRAIASPRNFQKHWVIRNNYKLQLLSPQNSTSCSTPEYISDLLDTNHTPRNVAPSHVQPSERILVHHFVPTVQGCPTGGNGIGRFSKYIKNESHLNSKIPYKLLKPGGGACFH